MRQGFNNQKGNTDGRNYMNGGGFGNRPKSVTCTICGREFGTASIEIHQKSCIQKYSNQMHQLPGDISRNMPNPQQVIKRVEQERELRKNGGTKKGMQFEQSAPTNFALVPCRRCGRRFNADRIQKHESVCIGPEPDVSAIKQKVIQQKKQAAKYLKPRKTGKWREEHAEFQQAMREMRKIRKAEQMGVDIRYLGPPAKSSVNSSYIQCPHCYRNFNEKAAQKHIQSCANVINKPKPPPGRSQQQYQQQQQQLSYSQQYSQQQYNPKIQTNYDQGFSKSTLVKKNELPPRGQQQQYQQPQQNQKQQYSHQHLKTPPQKQSHQKSFEHEYQNSQPKQVRTNSANKSQNLGGGYNIAGKGGSNVSNSGYGRPVNVGGGGGNYQIAHSNVSTFSLFTSDGRPPNYERYQQSNPYAKKTGLY